MNTKISYYGILISIAHFQIRIQAKNFDDAFQLTFTRLKCCLELFLPRPFQQGSQQGRSDLPATPRRIR